MFSTKTALEGQDGVAQLRAAGYKEFKDTTKIGSYYVTSFQKRVDDEKGKKYFINVTVHHFTDPRMENINWRYDADGQFNIDYFATGKSIAQIESFFEKLWAAMGCDHYEAV